MKKGFTLAEVLITLGIIGVVAALTIPVLIADYQEKAINTAREVFEARLYDGLRQMNVSEEFNGHKSTESFVSALGKYMKLVRTCSNSSLTSCFPEKITNGDGTETVNVSTLKSSSTLNEANWGTTTMGIVMPSGYMAILAYDPTCLPRDIVALGGDLASCLSIVYDINGKSKPNKSAKDVGLIGANPFNTCPGLKFGSLCVDTNEFIATTPINTCTDTTYDSTGSGNSLCANNVWAGGKKACADKGMRMATLAEMAAMFNHGGILKHDDKLYWTDDRYGGSVTSQPASWAMNIRTNSAGAQAAGGKAKNDTNNRVICVK
jgi:prepilin-type N-terminal cleavage/methylation domain-containing protein